MNELTQDEFQDAIRQTHGAGAKLQSKSQVLEKFEGATAWEGEVLIFALNGKPTATKCYAWSVDGRVTAVLHEGPINSPAAAVRFSIVHNHKAT